MRVVVIGATGNVGTSLIEVLGREPGIDHVLGLARRIPQLEARKTDWAAADVASSDLASLLRGADAAVHLAWQIQPSRDLNELWRTNVVGSTRVFRAVAEARVGVVVYASSVGVYSPGPKDRRVDESWPRDGVRTSFYARHKAEVERRLDRFEREHPEVRVVRLRPGLTFKRAAASGVRRLFLGPFFPSRLARPRLIPIVPDIPSLRVQGVHSLDVGEAYRLALTREVHGAFNIAADPVIEPRLLCRLLHARPLRVSARIARVLTALTWQLRLQPSPPGWLDLALRVPLMDTTRAQEQLEWTPMRGADEALLELLAGMSEKAGMPTPPLEATRMFSG